MENVVRVLKLSPDAQLPTYGSTEAAAADLYACLQEAVIIQPGETAWIPTGIALEVPKGCAGLVFARSSMGAKRGLAPANKVGVIDSDYRGEIRVVLLNHSDCTQVIEPNERVAQFMIVPVIIPEYVETTSLTVTDRGTGGFGSTGR